ncbi:MAG: hypothetical protein JST52_03415 [Bacteroidetes bacterium]|nr:hypothetical protein [Bacteroidota bacterium]MBS1738904.1 hypothetical protein [Bacteroidota bacterium]MBS1776583.1 hypothetical protein [Bacteroidota bacterium]
MTRQFACLLLFILSMTEIKAQPLSAYVNIQNQVMVWDNGMIRKIDYLAPISMKIGRTTIPYLDNSRSFKIYYGGGVRTINIGFTNDYFVSDNLVAFINARSLNVFDNGKVKNLSGMVQQYYLGDSVLLFLDGIRSEYKAYYNGEVYPIENFLAGNAIDVVKVSDNIAAYVNYANQFRIFISGKIIPQENYTVSSFDVGRNTVAYVDINKQFKIFHNGNTIVAENFPPLNYAVGDNVVAYVSNDGYFKIFYNDSVQTIGYFNREYKIGDNVVAFRDGGGWFKAFYKGDIISLESYYPDNFVVQYNSLAYVNRSGILRLMTEGEVYDVTSMFNPGDAGSETNWQLTYDVLKYQVGLNIFKIYYKGNEY